MDYETLKQEATFTFGDKNFCGVLAVAVAFSVPYEDAHAALELAGRKKGKATYRDMYFIAADLFGKRLVKRDFRAKTLRTLEREIPKKNFLVRATKHAVGVAEGRLVDWSAGRCKRIVEVFEVEDQ